MSEPQEQKPRRMAKLRTWYAKYERPISSISLVGGFVFDALTLKRVDLFWENFWVVAHLIIVGTCIVLVNSIEKTEGDEANPSRAHFWLVNILQFFFGGILSTYLVFYFRSSDIAVGWPFLLILALAFWANEALKRHFVRLVFQIALFFLSIFCFAIFLVPILLHQIGPWIFLISGLASVIFISLFLYLIWHSSGKKFRQNKYIIFSSIAGIFILVNALYFTDILPPIPLSLKDAGVYYSIQRNSQGDYVTIGETEPWTNYFKFYPDFHYLPNSPVIVYSAIFSPSKLNITVVHQWQRQDAQTGKWLTVSQVPLTVVGGRDGGFRTYSEKTLDITPGHWRVNVLTTRGQVIGRIRFNLVLADALPKVLEKVNN
jgi:hypothetical protein